MEPDNHRLLMFNPKAEPEPDPEEGSRPEGFHYFRARGLRRPQTPEERAQQDAEEMPERLRMQASLRASLTALLAKHLLPFRPPGSK